MVSRVLRIIMSIFISIHYIHHMMTSSNGNIFRVTGSLCGEFTVPDEFPTQRPVTRSFDVFFDLRLNKRLSKQPWGWWFETPSWSLWHQSNDTWECVSLLLLCRIFTYPGKKCLNLYTHGASLEFFCLCWACIQFDSINIIQCNSSSTDQITPMLQCHKGYSEIYGWIK